MCICYIYYIYYIYYMYYIYHKLRMYACMCVCVCVCVHTHTNRCRMATKVLRVKMTRMSGSLFGHCSRSLLTL